MKRRTWLNIASAALAVPRGRARAQAAQAQTEAAPAVLPIEHYQPKSMLHAAESHVPRARFPLIDFHTHITGGSADGARIRFSLDPAGCLALMDRKNIRTMVDVTGSYGPALAEAVAKLPEAHSGRFVVFTEPAYSRTSEPDYPTFQADQIAAAHKAGARGLKVLKNLGTLIRTQTILTAQPNICQTGRAGKSGTLIRHPPNSFLEKLPAGARRRLAGELNHSLNRSADVQLILAG